MQHLDEGTIHAWLDGALGIDEAARAEAHVASCSACAEAVAEARGLIAAASRILTALDAVPSVTGAGTAQEKRRGSAGEAQRKRWNSAGPSLTTWLVRERIAAVLTLVVAGGALALVIARDTPQAVQRDLASEPVRTMELAAADSPAPVPVVAQELRSEASAERAPRASASSRASGGGRDLSAARQTPESAPPPALIPQAEVVVTANAAAPPPARTDDSLRAVRVAEVQAAESRQERAADVSSSVAGKAVEALTRRRTAEGQARFAEPRAAAPSVGGATGAAAAPPAPVALTGGPRLVQEERMTEGGRDVRRRIYRVDDVLVTLDERLPMPAGQLEQARAAAAEARLDSAAVPATIRWTDPSGTEFTLTGPASRERLERIRKLLGY